MANPTRIRTPPEKSLQLYRLVVNRRVQYINSLLHDYPENN